MRVTHYEYTISYPDAAPIIEMCRFTEAHANAISAVLEPDGIDVKAAQALCDKWNLASRRYASRCSYRLVLEPL